MSDPRVDDKVGKMSINPLYDARVQRGISLETIASTTRLSPRVVSALDSGHFDAIPAGLYARSYVRAFAKAVALDPEAVLAQLSDRLPAVVELSPAFAEKPHPQTEAHPPQESHPLEHAHAEEHAQPEEQHLQNESRPAATALVRDAIIDAAFLLSLSAMLVAVVSEYCGLPSVALVRLEPGPIVGLCAPVWVMYEVLLGRLGAHRILSSGSSLFIPWAIGLSALVVRPTRPIINRLGSWFNSASVPAAAESVTRFTRSAGSFFRS
jgi:Helix-turn-helix domain